MSGHVRPPGPVGTHPETDARAPRHVAQIDPPILDEESRPRQSLPVLTERDAECAREIPGAAAELVD